MIPLSKIKKEKEKKLYIDINADIGQSFGVYRNELELELLPYVSSVNISCGAHAGDPVTIMRMLKIASEKGLAVGAHIGYPDIQGFGYRSMKLNEEEMQALVVHQIGALTSLAKIYNVDVEYVRPHGALYVQAAQDFDTSLSIAKALHKYDPWLIYVGAVGDTLNKVAQEVDIRVAPEVLLDKKYTVEGNIDFDSEDVMDLDYSVKLLKSLTTDSTVFNPQGGKTKVDFKTIHLSMKAAISLDIAKNAKECIPEPTPIPGTLIVDCDYL